MDHYIKTAPIEGLRQTIRAYKGTTDPIKRLLRMKCNAEIRRRMSLIKGGVKGG